MSTPPNWLRTLARKHGTNITFALLVLALTAIAAGAMTGVYLLERINP